MYNLAVVANKRNVLKILAFIFLLLMMYAFYLEWNSFYNKRDRIINICKRKYPDSYQKRFDNEGNYLRENADWMNCVKSYGREYDPGLIWD